MKRGWRAAGWAFVLIVGMTCLGGLFSFPLALLPVFVIGGWILSRHGKKYPPKPTPVWALTFREIERRHRENLRVIELSDLPPEEKAQLREEEEELKRDRIRQLMDKNLR